MKNTDENHIGDTIRIRRPPRIHTNELGWNIWLGGVEPCELEFETNSAFNPYDSTAISRRSELQV